MESYQIFSFCKRFYMEREKTIIELSRRIEKLRKLALCFITGCFIKHFKTVIILSSIRFCVHWIFISFVSSFAVAFLLFDTRIMQEISKREIENGKFLGMANYNVYFKTKLNLLVINITQINFLYWQNVSI